MFLASFPAGPWQTNCYLVGAEGSGDVVVIDPGVQAAPAIAEGLADRGLGVAGVLLTHGHVDHVASAADVAEAHQVPVWLHADERELLSDAGPILPTSRELAERLGVRLREPADLRFVTHGEEVPVGGLTFRVHHAPGHRPGCVMYDLADGDDTLLFTGDVLFAGSIGRTDLPGGDPDAMARSLREVVLPLPDAWTVLPGHGPATTIGAERATNPYLRPPYLSEAN